MKRGDFLIAFFATIVQFYNYGLFGLSAAILAKSFMPPCDNINQLLSFFGILAITVIARPIGAIIFGYIADLYGRSASIKIAVILGIFSTFLIAIIPEYKEIGILSAYFLLISRMLFLMSQAGEIDATRIYVIEKIGKYKNLANGIISFCSQLGVLVAGLSYYYSYMFQYQWRINFILGSLAGIIVIILRSYFQESYIFIESKNSISNSLKSSSIYGSKYIENKFNILEIVRLNKNKFLLAMLISGACGGIYHFLIIFFNIFATKILCLISLEQAQFNNIILISSYGICAIISGFIADKINPLKQIIIALIASFICVLLFKWFLPLDIRMTKFLITSLVILLSFYMVPLQVIVQSLFDTKIKARLCSLSHALGGILLSSSIPFFSTLIWQKTYDIWFVLNIYLSLVVAIFIAVIIYYYQIYRK